MLRLSLKVNFQRWILRLYFKTKAWSEGFLLKFNVNICFYVSKIVFNVPVYEFCLWSSFSKNVQV
jgi:hypothetical protein